jgi:sortase A
MFQRAPSGMGPGSRAGALGRDDSGETSRRWSAMTVAIATLALAGLILIGQGLWIQAKALLAQVLLERVEVTRLGRSAIVLNGSSGQALAFGPGQVERTPDAGEAGTAIYSAHRDTHFAFLGDVAIGDEIKVTRRDRKIFRFRVVRTSVVRWDASGIDPQADGTSLVLVTCWPLDGTFSGPLRYLVHAELIE